jgi:hypothetical protein
MPRKNKKRNVKLSKFSVKDFFKGFFKGINLGFSLVVMIFVIPIIAYIVLTNPQTNVLMLVLFITFAVITIFYYYPSKSLAIKDKHQIVTNILMALFMFFTFYISYLNYAPKLVYSGELCPFQLQNNSQTTMMIGINNFGEGSSIYKIIINGDDNINFSNNPNAISNRTLTLGWFAIDGKGNQNFQINIILDAKVNSISYVVNYYQNNDIKTPFVNKTCEYEQTDSSSIFVLKNK